MTKFYMALAAKFPLNWLDYRGRSEASDLGLRELWSPIKYNSTIASYAKGIVQQTLGSELGTKHSTNLADT